MSEIDYLVGVEEYELAFVEDVLDDNPVDAQTVYKETIDMSERAIAAEAAFRTVGGGGGGAPSGPAGGDLTGTYPNPTLAADYATQVELDAHVNDAADAHDASAISILDTASDFTATDVEGALAELQSDNEAHIAAADPHTGYVLESLFDANTVLKADSDNTPAALTMGASTVLARLAAGSIVAATPTEIRTLLDVPTTGEAVLDTLYDAHTVLAATSDNTPAAITMGASTILARLAAGNIVAASVAEIVTLIGPLLPGFVYTRNTITTTATSTATSAATATTIITATAVTPGAAIPIRIRVQGASLGNSASVATVVNLWRAIDGGAAVDLGFISQVVGDGGGGTATAPLSGEYVDTPGAGSIVYTVRMWVSSASTGTMYATTPYTPASITITRV